MTKIVLKINPASGIITHTEVIASDFNSHSWGIGRLQFFREEITRFAEGLFMKAKKEQVACAIRRDVSE